MDGVPESANSMSYDYYSSNVINQIPVIERWFALLLDCICPLYCRKVNKLDFESVVALKVKQSQNQIDSADTHYICLNIRDREELVSLATIAYLDEWIECDSRCKQSINSYAKHGFCCIGEESRKRPTAQLDTSGRSRLVRAEKKVLRMMEKRVEQAERESTEYKDFSVPFCKNKVSLGEAVGSKLSEPNKGGKLYSFLDLCFFDWVSNQTHFFSLLLEREKLLEKTNQRGRNRNNPIREVYQDYFEMLRRLDESDDRSYVVSQLLFYKLERTMPMVFPAYLACFAENKDIPKDILFEYIVDETQHWWMRYKYLSCFCSGREMIDYPYGILTCAGAIKAATEKDPKKRNYLFEKQLLKRGILSEMILLGNHPLHHPKTMPSWTGKDFEYASKYFRRINKRIDMCWFKELDKPEKWSDSLCDNIRRFYEIIQGYELDNLRIHMQSD